MHNILMTHTLKEQGHVLILSHYSDDNSDYHEIHIVNIINRLNSASRLNSISWLQTANGIEHARREFDRYVESDRVQDGVIKKDGRA